MNTANYTRVPVSSLRLGDKVLQFDDRTADNLGWATVIKITPKGESRKDENGEVVITNVNWLEVEMRSKAPEIERETWRPTREVMVAT